MITTTLAWHCGVIYVLYPLIAIALLLTQKSKYAAALITFCILTPTTIILIKRQLKEIESYKNFKSTAANLYGTITSVRPSFDYNICTLCTLKTNYISINQTKHKIQKNIHLFLPPRTYARTGQKIYIDNIKIKHPAQNSYHIFCLQNNIWGIVHTNKNNFTLYHTDDSQAVSVFDKITRSLSLRTKILFNLIFLGKKIKEIYRRTFNINPYTGAYHTLLHARECIFR